MKSGYSQSAGRGSCELRCSAPWLSAGEAESSSPATGRRIPPEFRKALREAKLDLELLIALPEHRVPLPGGSRPSQTDLFVLARDESGALITIAVEGKAGEPFGPLVSEWLRDDQGGETKRLAFLLETLGLPSRTTPCDVRHQLLHRTASAVIEAGRFNAQQAMMVVHSFSDDLGGFSDFVRFASMLGVDAQRRELVRAPTESAVPIWLGWADGQRRYSKSWSGEAGGTISPLWTGSVRAQEGRAQLG